MCLPLGIDPKFAAICDWDRHHGGIVEIFLLFEPIMSECRSPEPTLQHPNYAQLFRRSLVGAFQEAHPSLNCNRSVRWQIGMDELDVCNRC